MTVSLRPFQEKALADYRKAWFKATSHIGVAPTAFGKTIFMAWVARAVQRSGNFRSIVVAHREALVAQNADKARRVAPELKIQIEAAGETSDGDADIVSCSIQTLRGARLDACVRKWRADGRPLMLFIDEAHHAAAPSYERLIAALKPERHLGVTATPGRADGKTLTHIYPEVAFEIPRGEMIDGGWLARPHHFVIETNASLEGVKLTKDGDYRESELVERLATDERNKLILSAALEAAEVLPDLGLGQVARGVCFALSVEHAYRLAEDFRSVGWDAVAISGQTPVEERREADELLRRNPRHTILVSYGVLTEGWDVEEANLGLFVRPTKSRGLMDQMLGRLLRILPNKRAALCVDFADRGAEGRVSLSSVFKLPRNWNGLGECLRNDELWFGARVQGSPFHLRAALWRAETRARVDEILAAPTEVGAELYPGREYIWWNLGDEIRLIMDNASVVVFERVQGDFLAEYRWGCERRALALKDELADVLTWVEEWLEETYPDQARFRRLGRDNGARPSEKQIALLERLGFQDLDDVSFYRAKLMINQAIMEDLRRGEEGIMGFGKHKGLPIAAIPANYIRFVLAQASTREWMEKTRRPELTFFERELERRARGV